MIQMKPQDLSVVVSYDDLVALYLELNQRDNLDRRVAELHNKLERLLFQKMTIQDFESLEDRYTRGETILGDKGDS